MNEGEGGTNNPRGVRVSAASRSMGVGAFSFTIEKPLSVPGRCSAGAVECATNEDEDEERPHHHRAPSERSRRHAGCATKRRHHLATSLLSSPLSPVISCSRFRCTSSSYSAERYAPRTEPLWKLARSPARGIDVRARRTSCSDQTRVDRVSDD